MNESANANVQESKKRLSLVGSGLVFDGSGDRTSISIEDTSINRFCWDSG